jgi:hypothetical protein
MLAIIANFTLQLDIICFPDPLASTAPTEKTRCKLVAFETLQCFAEIQFTK